MDKPKNIDKDSPRPNYKFWGCLGVIAFACAGTWWLFVSFPKLTGQLPQTSLPITLIPTAEALLSAPLQVTLLDGQPLSLELIENYSDSEDAICVRINYPGEEKFDAIFSNSSLFINGAWIIGSQYGLITMPSTGLHWCGVGTLQAGLHLIEFHLKDSFWGEPIHIQQWAIRLGE
jgi:hypothetical protein